MDTAALALLARLTTLHLDERRLLAEFIRTLAEVERKRIPEALGYSSILVFLMERFGLSKASAYRRHAAAELNLRIPTALTEENHPALLAKAETLSEDEVRNLAWELKPGEPRPVPRDSIRRLPPRPVENETEDLFTRPAGFVTKPAPPPSPPEPQRHLVQMTVGPEFLALVEKARSAFSHTHAGATLEELLSACMKLALEEKAKRQRGETKTPRQPRPSANPRYIPRAVRRAVSNRDGGRCAFVGEDGRRCNSAHQLEYHHILAASQGGRATIENISLRCRAHNDLEARRTLGDDWMDRFTGKPSAHGHGPPEVMRDP